MIRSASNSGYHGRPLTDRRTDVRVHRTRGHLHAEPFPHSARGVRTAPTRRREVLLQNVLVDLPVLDAPVGWRDQEHPGYGCNCLLLRDVLQHDRCPQRMTDEKDLAIKLIEFTCYPVSPRRVLRAILLWHLRTPPLVPAAQRVTKTCRHFPVFLVCPFSAAMNEQQLPFHSCVPDWMAFFPSANDRPFASRARRSCASAFGPTPCNPSTSAWLTLVR